MSAAAPVSSPTAAPPLGRPFWLYRWGQFVSQLGDSCGNMALGWWVLKETGDAQIMSAALAPVMAAQVFLGPLLAPFADRMNRKWLAMGCDGAQVIFQLVLAWLSWKGPFSVPLLVGIMLLAAFASALFRGATAGLLSQMVAPENMDEASRHAGSFEAVALLMGGVLAGGLLQVGGVTGAFAFNALSFVFSYLCFVGIPTPDTPRRKVELGKNALVTWALDIREGFALLGSLKILMQLALVAMLLNFMLTPMAVLLPTLVQQGTGLPPWFLGLLESSLGVGVLFAMVVLAQKLKVFSGDLVFIGATVGLSVPLFLVAFSPTPWLFPLAFFLMGGALAICNQMVQARFAASIPNAIRARMSASVGFLAQAITPLGVGLAGTLAQRTGPQLSFGWLGGGAFLASLCLFFAVDLRKFFAVPLKNSSAHLCALSPRLKALCAEESEVSRGAETPSSPLPAA